MRASCDPRCSVAFGALLRPGGRHVTVGAACHPYVMIRGPWLLRIRVLSGASIRAVRPTRRGDHTVHLKRIVPRGDARGMRTCPKCKTPTLAPLAEDRADMPEVVPPSRCTHCQGVWLPHEAIEKHLVPASVDTERAAPLADGLAGFCPREEQ